MPNSHVSDGGEQPSWRPRSGLSEPERPETPESQKTRGQPAGPFEPASAAPDLSAELARIEDRYKRALADLDNYRKRSQREIDRRVTEARESVILDWLEALDSVERALLMGPEDPLNAGLQAVLEQMEAILAREGVTRIGAAGDQFDPDRHEAVGVRLTGEVPDRTILELARSGFTLGDRVLRPAQVVVARTPEPAS
jgi:molecular chaperone GrpE